MVSPILDKTHKTLSRDSLTQLSVFTALSVKVCVEIRSMQCFICPLVPSLSQVLPQELQHASLGLHSSNFYIALKFSTYI